MMVEIFLDTDIILDLLVDRKPFNKYSEALFELADSKDVKIFVSSLSFSNLFYVLRKHSNIDKAYEALINLKILVNILTVDDKIISLALNSDFNDFEDAIQYFTAKENGVDILITRNTKDYKKADIKIASAEEFLKLNKLL
jgi:predicted nucleic acid-binding protein